VATAPGAAPGASYKTAGSAATAGAVAAGGRGYGDEGARGYGDSQSEEQRKVQHHLESPGAADRICFGSPFEEPSCRQQTACYLPSRCHHSEQPATITPETHSRINDEGAEAALRRLQGGLYLATGAAGITGDRGLDSEHAAGSDGAGITTTETATGPSTVDQMTPGATATDAGD
jgi:hypothetical protein